MSERVMTPEQSGQFLEALAELSSGELLATGMTALRFYCQASGVPAEADIKLAVIESLVAIEAAVDAAYRKIASDE